uniref:Uncharacterized protein n=1 Tax=Magallana gigas TaxID=29159 RepID=A0A8W8M511_MAGGI
MNILDDAVFGQEVEESHQREIPCDGGVQSTSNKFLTTPHQHPVTPEQLQTLQQSRLIAPPFKCSSVSIQSVLFVFQLYSETPSPYHSLGGASSGYHVNSN